MSTTTANGNTAIKTDEKKQHFDDIYVEKTPVPYKVRILDALTYISDDFNRQMFDRLILPWIQQQNGTTIHYVDLCACFGNTTMATVHGMSYKEICTNWQDETSCQTIQKPRRFQAHTTGIDISANAMAYGKTTGIFDTTITADLNILDSPEMQEVCTAMKKAQVMISTAALVYLDIAAIDKMIAAFASGAGDGYILVNFLNPFSLEKADLTKSKLLDHLQFVGSMASRHRKLSPLEQANYPGEEWSLLELWVLKRRT